MPVITAATAPIFAHAELQVTGLAAPSRGAVTTCVWKVVLPAGAPGTPHSMDREEIFIALAGRARATVGAEAHTLEPGDTLIVPAGETFALANPGSAPFEALAVLPVGGKAELPGMAPFSPPWTL